MSLGTQAFLGSGALICHWILPLTEESVLPVVTKQHSYCGSPWGPPEAQLPPHLSVASASQKKRGVALCRSALFTPQMVPASLAKLGCQNGLFVLCP